MAPAASVNTKDIHFVRDESERRPDLARAKKAVGRAAFVGISDLYHESLCLFQFHTTGSIPSECACMDPGHETKTEHIAPCSFGDVKGVQGAEKDQKGTLAQGQGPGGGPCPPKKEHHIAHGVPHHSTYDLPLGLLQEVYQLVEVDVPLFLYSLSIFEQEAETAREATGTFAFEGQKKFEIQQAWLLDSNPIVNKAALKFEI
eukprot:gene31770-6967_t